MERVRIGELYLITSSRTILVPFRLVFSIEYTLHKHFFIILYAEAGITFSCGYQKKLDDVSQQR